MTVICMDELSLSFCCVVKQRDEQAGMHSSIFPCILNSIMFLDSAQPLYVRSVDTFSSAASNQHFYALNMPSVGMSCLHYLCNL